MNRTKSRLQLGADSTAASALVAGLLEQQRAGKEWTDEDAEELRLAQRNYAGVMTQIARVTIIPALDSYVRPPCPARPGRLPMDDARLAKDLRVVGRKERRSKSDKAFMSSWADHLRAVHSAEAAGASRVRTLLRYLGHAEAFDDAETVELFRGFLERNWGWSGPVPSDVDAVAVELARRRDIISDRLMYGEERSSKVDAGPKQICASEVV